MRKREAIVIAGTAGVGKTELANYIEAINNNRDKYDYILVFTKLQDLDLEYEFFFPCKTAIPEYEQRLLKRGGRWVEWSKTVYAEYDKHLKTAQGFGKPIVFLEPGETLESFLLQNEGKYPKLVP
jgi:hypothetical protein